MDVRQQVTEKIIAMMEQGQVTGESMWDATVRSFLPVNYQTKLPYKGVNLIKAGLIKGSTIYSSRFFLKL